MPIPVTTTRRSAAIWRVVLEVAKVRVWETEGRRSVCVVVMERFCVLR